MRRRCVAPYPTRPTRPLERSHCRANPPRTVRVHCEHLLVWSECTGRTRRSGRSVYTGNSTRTVRERFARRVKLPVCTRPKTTTTLNGLCRPGPSITVTHSLFLFANYLADITTRPLLQICSNTAVEGSHNRSIRYR